MADIKFYFLVSGRTKNNGFSGFAHKLAREIAKTLVSDKKKWTARFIHFDFWKNVVEVGDFTPTQTKDRVRGRPSWGSLDSFTPGKDEVDAQNPKTFVDTTKHKLEIFEDDVTKTVTEQFSITNVYHSVRGCPADSVMEVSFVSHGFMDGPVLVNSSVSPFNMPLAARPRAGIDDRADPNPAVAAWDSFRDNLPKRWEQDGDCRMDADFATNMGEDPDKSGTDLALDGTTKLKGGGKDALFEFKDALNVDARMRILGCNVQDVAYDATSTHRLIKSTVLEVLTEAIYRGTVPRVKGQRDASTKIAALFFGGTIKSNQPLTFDLKQQFQDEADDTTDHYQVHNPDQLRLLHFKTDTAFFGSPPPSSTIVTTTWKDLVKFVAGQAPNTYQFQAATVLGIDVLATPLGASGEIEKDKDPDKMVACGEISRCKNIVRFYEKYLDLPVKDDGYSLFNVTSLDKIRQHATDG